MSSKIRCAAIRWPSGDILTGEDHGVVIQKGIYCYLEPADGVHGFVDEDGKFLNRSDAYERAVVCGQIKDDGGTRSLCSEMLRNKGQPYKPC